MKLTSGATTSVEGTGLLVLWDSSVHVAVDGLAGGLLGLGLRLDFLEGGFGGSTGSLLGLGSSSLLGLDVIKSSTNDSSGGLDDSSGPESHSKNISIQYKTICNDSITYFFLMIPSSLPFLFNLLQAWVHINLAGFFLLINNLLALEPERVTG